MGMPELTDHRQVWSDAIYVERHRQRLKQVEVARLTGLDQATISNAENGSASAETYRSIAKALGIELTPGVGE